MINLPERHTMHLVYPMAAALERLAIGDPDRKATTGRGHFACLYFIIS